MKWYHAGAMSNLTTVWSDHSRRTPERAEREARRLASKLGASYRPVVESWDRKHGPRPGWDCANDAWFVDCCEVTQEVQP